MALDADPYRILGLSRGASLDEVKRAYRRLAKVHHPDAAGESALPRFLAIQAAYEQLLGGPPGGTRGRRGSPAPRRPWEADPERSDATRRAYGGRARSAPPGARRAPPQGTGAPPGGATGGPDAPGSTEATGASGGTGSTARTGRTGPEGPTSARTGRRRTSGSAPGPRTGPAASPGDGSSGSRATKRNKATLGSTSYDGADGPFEPDWGGASWYGTTSGTYWTLNPKEYADPRKHGPEYQARARRAARARSHDAEPVDPTVDPPDEAGSATDTAADPPAGPTHSTRSWWDSTAGPAAAPSADYPAAGPDAATRRDARRRAAPPPPPPPDLGRAAADITRALTDEGFGGMRGRFVRAIVGWLPIAFGVGWLAGEITGCGRFSATCDGATEPFVLLGQVAILAVLLLVPVLASLATTAALALFVAAIGAALVLSATGEAADGDARRAALGAVLLVAWLIGLAIAVLQRVRAVPSPTRPVS